MPDLREISLDGVAGAQQAALLRLHLRVTREMCRMLTEYAEGIRTLLVTSVKGEGDATLDAAAGLLW